MANDTENELGKTAREQLQNAFDHVKELVDRLPDGAWLRPSPCEGWTVREVLNHLTSEHLWAPRLLAGETMEQVGGEYDGDVLGDDPVAAWDTAQMGSREAWASVQDDTPVHLSFGDTTAGEYAEQMLLDLTVHAWDIAKGAGVQEGPLVSDSVLHVLDYARAHDLGGKSPFGAQVSTDSDDPQDQLVALLGRQP